MGGLFFLICQGIEDCRHLLYAIATTSFQADWGMILQLEHKREGGGWGAGNDFFAHFYNTNYESSNQSARREISNYISWSESIPLNFLLFFLVHLHAPSGVPLLVHLKFAPQLFVTPNLSGVLSWQQTRTFILWAGLVK